MTIAKPSGKVIGSNSLGRITPIAPPKPISPAAAKLARNNAAARRSPSQQAAYLARGNRPWDYRTDPTYQQQESDSHTALQDYLAGQNDAQGSFNVENARNNKNLQDSEGLANQSMADDFGSRGLGSSGLLLQEMARQANDYAKQRDVLATGATNFVRTAGSQLNNFRNTQNVDSQKFKNDAINRHASSFGLI